MIDKTKPNRLNNLKELKSKYEQILSLFDSCSIKNKYE
jgi:hypothetical protein